MITQVSFGNLSDIPLCMERLAAEIREGRHGNPSMGVAVFFEKTCQPLVCGWGVDTDDIRAIGLLHLGAAWLSTHEVRR